jgi:hypothetical protein
MESGGTCLAHSPEAHAAAVAKGGAATAEKYRSLTHLKLETHEDCRKAAERIARDVLLGRIPARTGQVATALIRVAQVSIDSAIEDRLAELEAQTKAQQPAGVRRRR